MSNVSPEIKGCNTLELLVRCSRKSSWIAVMYVINMLTRSLLWPPYVRSSKCKSSVHVCWPQLCMNFFVALHLNLGSPCYQLTPPPPILPSCVQWFSLAFFIDLAVKLTHLKCIYVQNICPYDFIHKKQSTCFLSTVWLLSPAVTISRGQTCKKE